ncbi:lysine-rich arabinogalactan protein 19-like [Prionailurus bengalensis]|uniref:lysine-rich arabinogalactan protein 19-like n=1 Tax=Prionailurus bengalensis TaxID=37029 RepID=UPI001CA90B94|nr:lysine-rich arabinogalactan protein 19-like [Prionailurus bengalensis]
MASVLLDQISWAVKKKTAKSSNFHSGISVHPDSTLHQARRTETWCFSSLFTPTPSTLRPPPANLPPPSLPLTPASGLGGRLLASATPVIILSQPPNPPSAPCFLPSPSQLLRFARPRPLPRPPPASPRLASPPPLRGQAVTAARYPRAPSLPPPPPSPGPGPARPSALPRAGAESRGHRLQAAAAPTLLEALREGEGGRGENFCCGSFKQSRRRHAAARAPPRSPPLPARWIVGSPAHGKRSAAPSLSGPGTRLGRPSVAPIPAPACHWPSVAGEAGPNPQVSRAGPG